MARKPKHSSPEVELLKRAFANEVRRLRDEAGLSQSELARLAGLHRSEVNLIERGGREPRLTTIARLARALSVRPSQLLREVDGLEADG